MDGYVDNIINVAIFCQVGSRDTSLFADETDDEMRERLRKKMRKGLFNENGVAYAPWVTKQIDEDVRLRLFP